MDEASVRASSLSDLLDCPARWYASNVLAKRLPNRHQAAIGTAVHRGAQVFDEAYLAGGTIQLDECTDALADSIRNPDWEIDWSDMPESKAEGKALDVFSMYATDVGPYMSYSHVETMTDTLSVTFEGFRLNLTGTIDRIRKYQDGQSGIADIKTGATAVAVDGTVKTNGHGAQLGVYMLLAENVLGIELDAPAAIIGLNTSKLRHGIGSVPNAKAALIGPEGQPGILEMIAGYLKRGDFWGNPRSMLCTEKWCPVYSECRFR